MFTLIRKGCSGFFYEIFCRTKARQARSGHRGHVLVAAYALEAVGSFHPKKKSRRVSLADSFFYGQGSCRRHVSTVPTARLARRNGICYNNGKIKASGNEV
ncbi:MAG: hypothetical protein FWF77_04875 [Defluviitaleaceae bacterium]|nr:hypothetical protein [Defluviitaleaceae bacterium]